MFETIKRFFKKLNKKMKSNTGNSLAEFAVTTAMMATLATTAAPKFGNVGAAAKEKKSIANIDKILTVANNYYNQQVSEEGKGRFPGQSKYDQPVGGIDLSDGAYTDETLEAYIETILEQKQSYESEFAVTTAMMATLATTAAPKFGNVGAAAKEKKSIANIDKILTVANNYYNQQVSEEGKGRFPGQSKYDQPVGGIDLSDGAYTDETLEAYIETILEQKQSYESELGEFVYVFSTASDDDDALQDEWMNLETSVGFNSGGALDFKKDFGNKGIKSPFQDGSYAYLVIPGSGSGTDAQAPALVVIDTENPGMLFKTLVP